MARALALVCLVVALAGAGPRYKRVPSKATDPGIVAAEQLWAAAAAEQDRTAAVAAWEAAAAAFGKVVDGTTATQAERAEAAYAAILAWKNAMNVDPVVREPGSVDADPSADPPPPTPLAPREQAFLHAIEQYLTFAPPPDEAASLVFLRANILRRHNRFDEANAGFAEILADHPATEVAEYAANLLLDSFNRQRRYDELVALAERLRADTKFLAGKADLAAVVERIHRTAGRKAAEAVEASARKAGDRDGYDRCGAAYRALAAEAAAAAEAAEADELLYNAAACYEAAGSADAAVFAAAELVKRSPTSALGQRALARLAMIESGRAHYPQAIDALEQYVRAGQATGREVKDARDAASDAVFYALGIGDLGRAARVVDLTVDRFGARDPELAVQARTTLLAAMLAGGDRRRATTRARALAKAVAHGVRTRDAWLMARLGWALADASCPVALVDELCPRRRDRALVEAARGVLARAETAATGDDAAAAAADFAARIAIDLDLEPVLASKRPAAAAVDAVRDGYAALLGADMMAEVRIAAHARLGQLERHAGAADAAATQFRACVTLARDLMTGGDWLARCERGLADGKQPDADLLPERLAPSEAAVPMSTEGP